MMLTHAEVNRRFVKLDNHPALLTATFDGWLAWPVVKERLWLLCLNFRDAGEANSVPRAAALRRLASGTAQLMAALLLPHPSPRALLYEQRQVPLPDGGSVHPHLGTVSGSGPDVLHVIYGVADGTRHGTMLLDYGVGAVAAAIAWVIRGLPDIRTVSASIAVAVSLACPEIPEHSIRHAVTDQLARFRVRRMLFRTVFRRLGVRSVVVLDPDGKVAEVAAAKSLGLPVIEVQHGMFSAREPDYSWAHVHRASSARLPLPDKVIVFGAFWRDELLRAGYWRPDEIIQSQSSVIAAYRAARARRAARSMTDPVTIFFQSQAYVRSAALDFWREVLSGSPESDLQLRIKVHPLEEAHRSDYGRLVDEFPQLCRLVPDGVDGFEEMLKADVVAGYTSLMLLEAVGLDIPVIGLRGGPAAEGFASVFGLPADLAMIKELDTAAEFLEQVQALRQPGALEAASRGVASMSSTVFDRDGPRVEAALARL